MLTVKKVHKNSIAREIGVERGDKIVAFDGFETKDILDYLYYDSSDKFTMTVERLGKRYETEIEKDFDETLGMEFESDNLEIQRCHNKCVFCFVDQMPSGLRNSLYVKDDDYRQSFLCGNYVTLTNVDESDVQRIIRLKLSPLYISVQATDGETRKKLLNNRFADKINEYVRRFNDAGIQMHTQVVLVRGMNDGEILEKTCFELAKYENVLSLAVVPCGITAFRDGLYHIDDIDREYAGAIVGQIRRINKELKRNFVFCADEFFVRAGMETENAEFYGKFEQLENGVGMFRAFESEFNQVARKRTYRRTFVIVTGVSAQPFIKSYAMKSEALTEGLKVYVVAIKNKFFGETVTCTGLLTATDIVGQMADFKYDYDELVISDVMLKDGERLFIDGMTVGDLEKRIGKPVRVVGSGGANFFESISADTGRD